MYGFTVKKAAAVFLLLALVCNLAGCASRPKVYEDGFKIYRMNAGVDTLVWELADHADATDIDGALALLASEPSDPDMLKLIPDGVEVLDWYFGEDGQLVLDFNQLYQNIDGVAELLCRAGVVKTLCQIESTEYVEFYVEGQPFTLPNGRAVGLMNSADFIDNTGTDTKFSQIVNITVYFANETGDMMSESLLRVEYDGQKTLEEIVLYELSEGPLDAQTGLYPVMPEGTAVNKVSTRDGIAYVDLNQAFLNGRDGVSDEVTVYSIVNSLVDISYITKVQFLIDGSAAKNLGSVSLTGLLDRRPELITTEKAVE
ncbi:MAG: GerMN domain-containing protein [Lachnospiraceae bacterium]|nr:GerMN domain-containing protein [Lachnospiraceae bacterium]